jgi:hypothetical protein
MMFQHQTGVVKKNWTMVYTLLKITTTNDNEGAENRDRREIFIPRHPAEAQRIVNEVY